MRQPTSTDINAARKPSPRFSTDSFESVLPPEALDELRGRKPRTRQQRTKAKWSCPPLLKSALLSGALAASPLFVLAAVAAITWVSGVSLTTKRHPMTRDAQAPVPVSTPAGRAATPVAPATIEHVIEQPILPPRAQLVKLPSPPPRATLVRMPQSFTAISPEHIDEEHDITMPYGTQVSATLRGFPEQESQFPRVGHIGDMYVVGNVS
jgi:hypothetical protein